MGHRTSDGLLTAFFLVAVIELKRELVVGELRTPAAAPLPVVAAVCGMAVPTAVYAATAVAGGGSLKGWACRWPPTSHGSSADGPDYPACRLWRC